jgi:hypothetical protein
MRRDPFPSTCRPAAEAVRELPARRVYSSSAGVGECLVAAVTIMVGVDGGCAGLGDRDEEGDVTGLEDGVEPDPDREGRPRVGTGEGDAADVADCLLARLEGLLLELQPRPA